MSNTAAETGTSSSFGGLAAKQTYQFQSTSAFINPSRLEASYAREETVLYSSFWDDPGEEDPIGEYNLPVGDTPWLWMLILAVAYIAIRRVRKRAHARVP